MLQVLLYPNYVITILNIICYFDIHFHPILIHYYAHIKH